MLRPLLLLLLFDALLLLIPLGVAAQKKRWSIDAAGSVTYEDDALSTWAWPGVFEGLQSWSLSSLLLAGVTATTTIVAMALAVLHRSTEREYTLFRHLYKAQQRVTTEPELVYKSLQAFYKHAEMLRSYELKGNPEPPESSDSEDSYEEDEAEDDGEEERNGSESESDKEHEQRKVKGNMRVRELPMDADVSAASDDEAAEDQQQPADRSGKAKKSKGRSDWERPGSVARPKPYELRFGDFTSETEDSQSTTDPVSAHGAEKRPVLTSDSGVRIVQWNVERGLMLKEIIAELKALDPDVCILQELDWVCERTDNIDVTSVIASALRMQMVWVCEFQELYSDLRVSSAAQSRKIGQGGGSHGNAILSRFEILDAWAVPHEYQPYDWKESGALDFGEPRRGGRVALGAILETGMPTLPRLACYSAHLENNSGAIGRYVQFCEIIQDMRARGISPAVGTGEAHRYVHNSAAVERIANVAKQQRIPVILGGDLNTIAQGLALLLPSYFDALTLRMMMGEARYWNTRLLPLHGMHNVFGDSPTVQHAMGYYKAKLDWLLLNGFSVRSVAKVDTVPDRPAASLDSAGETPTRASKDAVNELLVDCRTKQGGAEQSDHQYLFLELQLV